MNRDERYALIALIDGVTKRSQENQFCEGPAYIDENGIRAIKAFLSINDNTRQYGGNADEIRVF